MKWPYLELPQRLLASTHKIKVWGDVFIACIYRKNINCSIDESLDKFEAVCNAAITKGIPVRG